MDRIAIQLGSITIYWYGVFVSLGFLISYLYLQARAKKSNVSVECVSDLAFASMIGGVVGARLFYVILNFSDYSSNPIEIIRIDHGGLVFYGGFIGAVLTVSWYIKKNKLKIWEVADLFALALPLGQAIGRIGCFINGCCFGKPSESWISYQYPHDSSVWAHQVHSKLIPYQATECLPVIPAQIFQSSINILIWIILVLVAKKANRAGLLFALYLILYSLGRFLNEFNRGDYTQHYIGLTISQVICLAIAPIGILMYRKRMAA